MSIEAINWALRMPGTPTQKHLLMVMANYANESGIAFPSVGTLMADTGMGKRTIVRAKKELLEAGLIEKMPRYGQSGIRLSIHIKEGEKTPQSANPAPQSATAAPNGARNDTLSHGATAAPQSANPAPQSATAATPPNHHLTTNNHHTLIPPTPQPKKSTASKRGHRLPDDWQPSQELIDYATERNLDPQREAEDFRDYWHSKPGAGGVKLDWNATWRTWCRRSADRQQQRFSGTGNVTPFPGRQQRNTRPPRDPFAGFADSFTDVEIPELSPEDKALMRRYRS